MSFTVVDDAPIRGFHRKLIAACCGGPLLDGYLLAIVGIALPGITAEMKLDTGTEALIGIAALIGMFFGGIVFGPLTDKIGRKPMYTIDLIALIVLSVLCVFATSAWQLILLRFALGVAIAADYPIATSLLTEWLPKKRRALMFSTLVIVWYLGTSLAYLVGFAINATMGEDQGWRWMLSSAAVLAVVVFLLRIGTPESPRWLVSVGRSEDACHVIKQALDATVMPKELSILEPERQSSLRESFRELFTGIYLRRMTFVFTFFTCSIIPLFALLTFGPQLLSLMGLGAGNVTNLGTAIINFVFALGCLPAMWLMERAGRRKSIIWSFGLMVLPLVALGLWAHAPGPFIVGLFCLYALFSGTPGILQWGYPNELFPTHLRAAAVGTAVSLTRFGAAIGTFLVPTALMTLGISTTMLIGAAITLVGFLACVAWAEETRNRSLEETGGTRLLATSPTQIAQTQTSERGRASQADSDLSDISGR